MPRPRSVKDPIGETHRQQGRERARIAGPKRPQAAGHERLRLALTIGGQPCHEIGTTEAPKPERKPCHGEGTTQEEGAHVSVILSA
ncbi:hypothetical protein GCM10011326_30120 [Salipiger profundus]|nr:hypothetical protein GCM10011326_30120 [Salipiger profundus]